MKRPEDYRIIEARLEAAMNALELYWRADYFYCPQCKNEIIAVMGYRYKREGYCRMCKYKLINPRFSDAIEPLAVINKLRGELADKDAALAVAQGQLTGNIDAATANQLRECIAESMIARQRAATPTSPHSNAAGIVAKAIREAHALNKAKE